LAIAPTADFTLSIAGQVIVTWHCLLLYAGVRHYHLKILTGQVIVTWHRLLLYAGVRHYHLKILTGTIKTLVFGGCYLEPTA